ncbi:MAG: hypothetical protein GTO08_10760 [Deltaproteobacteria bacterium]|nr:hypothetical protein [Deltaproteobacteria bacterium]
MRWVSDFTISRTSGVEARPRNRILTLLTAVVFVSLFILFSSGKAWGIIYIDINSPAGVRIPIAVPDLHAENEGGLTLFRKIPEIIAADLEISSIFTVINRDAYLEKISETSFISGGIYFPDWKMIGSDSLVAGTVRTDGDKLSAELRLYDVSTGSMLTGKRYSAPAERFDMIAHKFANEIIYQYTGVHGVFDSEIAFSAKKEGEGKEIFIVDLTGKKLRQITGNGSINMFPRWSPDGYKLAYLSYRRQRPYVFLRDFSTGSDDLLLRYGGFKSPGSFSPDGSSIFLSISVKGNADIFKFSFKDEKLVRVVSNYGIDVSPTVSPDEDKMAFVSDRTGFPQIYVKTLPSGPEKRVSFAGYYSTSPTWSPSGDRIAFASMSEGKFSIFVVSPDGSNLREVVSGDGSCEDPSFSPDGRYIVYIFRKKDYSEIRVTNVTGFGDRLLLKGMRDMSSPSWSPRR